jgi:NAD(P)-dependent dehydrogenase (short-subunit alcohol dehydrogenase family)
MNEPGRHRQVALVTGGSRGLGAATAKALAQHGFDVLLTCRNKAKRADEVMDHIARLGHRAKAVASDMTRLADRQRLIVELAAWGNGRLDLLILNAAGGLEPAKLAEDPDYPMRINRDAQVALVEQALPLMPRGSTIVYVTSHWSHLYGKIQQLPWYEPVAATKHKGELALRAMLPRLERVGVRLLIASGDMIEGTIMTRKLEHREPDVVATRRALLKSLPTADEAAADIVDAAINSTYPSGFTVVIGGSLQSVIDTFGVLEQA